VSSVFDYTSSRFIKKLKSDNKFDAIEELAATFGESGVCLDMDQLIHALKERENIMSTGIGAGIAIPHAKINSVKEMAFAIGVSESGIDFDPMDGLPVHLIILVVAGEKQHKEYLRLLSQVMAILKHDNVKENIIATDSPEEIIEILKRAN